MTPERLTEYNRLMAIACPHGPDEECTSPHHVIGCTCDIDWEVIHELKMEYIYS